MSFYYVGIDPGARGGIGYVEVTTGMANSMAMPTLEIIPNKKTSKTKNVLNMQLIAQTLEQFRGHCHVTIEDVHAFPEMGKVACFDFGMNFGQLLGIIEGLRLPYTRVPPQTWKKVVCAQLGTSKAASVTRACQLWPHLTEQFTWMHHGRPATHDGRAEALLIAEYGRIVHHQQGKEVSLHGQ